MRKISAGFLAASLFCVFFNVTYGKFSHGVHSGYMTFMFAYPLFGGAAVYLLIWALPEIWIPGRFVINVYNSGIAALTVGSMLRGIFDIAGTSSPYQPAFMIVGIAMVFSGLLLYMVAGLKKAAAISS
jgi:hypothetical protein